MHYYLGEILGGKKPELKTYRYSKRVLKARLKSPACVTLKGDNNLKIFLEKLNKNNVADPDPGSGAFSTPGPGSATRNRFIPDPGSQTHIF